MISSGAWRWHIGVKEHARLAVRRVAVMIGRVAVAIHIELEEQQHEAEDHQAERPVVRVQRSERRVRRGAWERAGEKREPTAVVCDQWREGARA